MVLKSKATEFVGPILNIMKRKRAETNLTEGKTQKITSAGQATKRNLSVDGD